MAPAARSPRELRDVNYWLHELGLRGTAAVTPIRDYLARGEDVDLDVSCIERGRGWRDRLPGDFVSAPSLRFGVFAALQDIGGTEAEETLVQALASTSRGVEVAYLTRVLHDVAADRHRDLAVSVAKQLLPQAATARFASILDRNHRDHLFSVLLFYGDASASEDVQAHLLRPDGIDRTGLTYLRRTLGRGVVPIVARAAADPAVADPAKREPLERVALDFVGVDQQAEEVWRRAINDPASRREHRKDLIEDLNESGFPDPEHPTARDLPLIDTRIALIDKLAPQALDAVNAAAFKEAHKDLVEMRRRATGERTPGPN
jgi:hypothetical protein